MVRGDSLTDVLQPELALEEYRTAYLERQTYESMWKFARAQIDVARLADEDDKELRDSLYNVAFLYAQAAARADSSDAEGHFMLSLALGRLSLTKGGKDRVRFAKEIYERAARAVDIDPEHDGAYHVLGQWHAEILRLSGIERFFAKTFLGGGFMDRASWDSATVYMERSVELKPEDLQHRFDLAGVYVDLERYDDARAQLEEVLRLEPNQDILDRQTQSDAAALLEEIRTR
ncbi:MAG: tetratricopeptide repeat protein [Gemmatimonadales bacterium]|jgi:tetratricopeptide (TPR) repeat protein